MNPLRLLPGLRRPTFGWLLATLAALAGAGVARAQRQAEFLDRGLVAVRASATEVFLSWRLLGNEPRDLGFNLYRATGAGAEVKLNRDPLVAGTNFTDAAADLAQANQFVVRPVLAGIEQSAGAGASVTLPAQAAVQPYLSLPLSPPAGGVTPSGSYTYRANDASLGDVDGDGRYEVFLKWDPTNSRDNSQSGHTGHVFLDACTLEGARLWRIDLGPNIRAGAHYTQFMVYDLDGDGRAELACKTAPGTRDGTGAFIGDASRFFGTPPGLIDHQADYRNASGYVLTGPEFLTIFDGATGAELATTFYAPPRNADPASSDVSAWGDNYGNRVDRFLACVAYLDGERPSLVMCRGYYTRAVLAAWDWRGGQLTQRWIFDSDDGTPGHSGMRGEGNHQLSVADVDADGRDEIIYGAGTIDDDGTMLHDTNLRHGDALHVSDLDPARPGLEIWGCHEDINSNGGIGLSLRAARTGERIFTVPNDRDTGRAVAIDIDPRHPGYEMWGAAGGLYSATGSQISASRPSSMNFAIWWDGDQLREIMDGPNNEGGSNGAPYIDKWNWNSGQPTRLLSATGMHVNNFTKANPCLVADLIGDWREELVLRSADSTELRIYTTTIPTLHRVPTLMHDPTYRLAVAWQNVAYNQPPHPGFFLGDGMSFAPTADLAIVGGPASAAPSRLANLSVRTLGGSGAETMILGFIIAGAGEQQMLVRGIGEGLVQFGVTEAMADARLDLFATVSQPGGGAETEWLSGNGDWWTATNASAVASVAESVWAFPLAAPGTDAAVLATFPAGAFTAHVAAEHGPPGIALAELYALGGTGAARTINASARAQVAPGEQTLIAGFVIAGDAPKTVLLRAVGPGLVPLGVDHTLPDPQVTLFRQNADGETWTAIATNADWSHTSGATLATFARLWAFPLPVESTDAALLLHLSPGIYTAHVSGLGAPSGVALIEVYDADR